MTNSVGNTMLAILAGLAAVLMMAFIALVVLPVMVLLVTGMLLAVAIALPVSLLRERIRRKGISGPTAPGE